MLELYLDLDTVPTLLKEQMYSFRTFKENEVHQNRTTQFHTMVLMLDGVLSFLEDGKRCDITAGHYYIQSAGHLQQGVPLTQLPVYFYIHFFGNISEQPFARSLKSYGKFDIDAFKSIFNRMMYHRNDLSEIEVTYYLCRIITDLLKYNKTPSSSSVPEQIALYISNHFAETDTLEDLCHKFSYSKDHIIRIFKGRYGITPYKYITSLKIQYAMQLLHETNLSVNQISYRCGYSDITVFYRAFKAISGMSPVSFRNNIKN